MKYPEKSCIVLVKRKSPAAHWATALFYWNGSKPTFAQYGSEITDVVEWQYKFNSNQTQQVTGKLN